MALIFSPIYNLDFDTDAGTDINWKLEVLRSYEEGTTPSWFEGGLPPAVQNITGAGSPIEIEYLRDRDVYKPIQGSRATIELIVETAGQYIDLNSGGPYEFQVRLRYRDGGNNLQSFWCGFINPISGQEYVNTFPFGVSFEAVDGLGLLEQSSVPGIDDTTSGIYSGTADIDLINVINYALTQTGLGLDVYIDSGIENASGDALINTSVNPYSFYEDSSNVNLKTLKSSLEGILSTFNCKITQSKGRWYIYNASSLKDSTTWSVFNSEGVAQADVVEALVYNITGTSGDIIPSKSNLVLNTRRPYGSIECNPTGFVSEDVVSNGGFELENEGWTKAGSADDLKFSTAVRLEGARSIFTDRSRFDLQNTGDVWFESTGGEIDPMSPLQINIDWLGHLDIDSGSNGARNVRLTYQVYFIPDTSAIANIFDSTVIYGGLNINPFTSTSVAAVFWDFENQKWVNSSQLFRAGDTTRFGKELSVEGSDLDVWVNEKININTPSNVDESDGSVLPWGAGQLYLRFFHPQANRPVGNGKNRTRGNRIGTVTAYVDNISVTHQFDNDITSPTFERVQENFTSTYEYTPQFASSTSDLIRQTIAVKDYNRDGVIENRSLEEIGTQFKLNDFRTQFKYYEGSLINNTSVPFSSINKININFSNYAETNNAIFNGGVFDPKKNEFSMASYIPNQTLDIASGQFDGTQGYSTENVDLVPSGFLGRSTKNNYILNVQIDTVDSSNDAVANGLTVPSQYVLFTGEAGSTQTENLILEPITGYIGVSGSTDVAADTSSTTSGEYEPGAKPRPFHVDWAKNTDGTAAFRTIDGRLVLPLTVTIPQQSESESIYIDGSVIEFTPEATPGTVASTVVVTNSGTNLRAPSTNTYNVSGVPGSTVHFTHHIAPVDSNWQVFGGNFDATYSDNSLTNLDAVGGPDGVSIDFAYSIPTTGESVAVTVTGNATAAGVIGVDIFTRTVIFGAAPSNVLFHEGSNIFTGVPGSTHDYAITLIPSADYQITSVASPSLPSGIVANGAPYQAGENWEIPIQVTIGSASDSLTINQGSIAVSEEPYSLTFNVNDLGISNAMISAADAVQRITFDNDDFGDSITPFVIDISPTSGSMFVSTSDIAVDVNESSVVVADGSTITLPESQFSAAVQLSSGGAIAVTIAGNFPSSGGQYTLDVNIVGNNSEGGAVEAPATTATLTRLTPGVSCKGGSGDFELNVDGRWLAELDTDFFTDAVNSGTGTFTESFTLPSGTWNIGGSYSPYRGEAGEHSITLNCNPFPFETAGSGATPFYSTGLEGRLTYTVSIYSQNINGSKGALLTTATIDQHQDYGPGEATVPAGFLDSTMQTISSATGYDQWTFNRPTS